MLDTARSYANCGWHVFPCKERGKTPLTKNGYKAATTDHSQIQTWWENRPTANIGIATGEISRFVVLDIDAKNNGEETLKEFGPLPDTPVVFTGNGRHVWFTYPDHHVPSSAGKIGAGLDIRGDGGYVIAPPSIHKNGKMYAWDIVHHPDKMALAPMPDWLVDKIQAPPAPHVEDPDAPILDGSRNATLFRLGCAMRKYGGTETAIAAALMIVNIQRCKPPLPLAEVQTIAVSATRYVKNKKTPF